MDLKENNLMEEWENLYASDSFRHKNEYPSTDIVIFFMSNFGKIKDKSKIKVLELGCGWGNNLKFLKDKGFDYYGIDFSETAVKHCQQNFKNVIQGVMSKLPYKSDYFDCVFDRMSIQCNSKSEIKSIFDEVHRVLKKEGLFFSILMSKEAKVDVTSTFLSKKEIENFSKKFNDVKIDFAIWSKNNESEIFKSYNVIMKK